MKVSVIGAGRYGSTLAYRLVLMRIAEELVLVDVAEGLPQGLALDIMQSRALEGSDTRVVGTNNYEDTQGSDIAVVTAGVARLAGMSRMDLLDVNARIVHSVVEKIAAGSPNAVLIVVTNPLDEMTMLAAEVSGFDKPKVLGQAGMLDTARFTHYLAEELGVVPSRIEAMTLGTHGDTMVPVPGLVKIDGRPLRDLEDHEAIERIVARTRGAGAEIVELLRTGSAHFAPASAAAHMVRAVATDSKEIMPVCAWMTGQYGISDVYMGVPARLGAGGVEEVVELALTPGELADMRIAAEAVRAKGRDLAVIEAQTPELAPYLHPRLWEEGPEGETPAEKKLPVARWRP
ncbi:MAG: malate dehydrogenase [Actinomycetota bacterium]